MNRSNCEPSKLQVEFCLAERERLWEERVITVNTCNTSNSKLASSLVGSVVAVLFRAGHAANETNESGMAATLSTME